MKLSQYAKEKGICYQTAYNWYKSGKLSGAYKTPSGIILVEESKKKKENIAIYCRVSSHNRRKELEYQVDRCKTYCLNKGYNVSKIFKEVSSGMNDNRKEFWKMIESNPTKIVVENKDRLTRFGFEYLKRLGKKLDIEIEVIFPNENDESDLMKDMISVVTSFCCRLYGLRRTKNKLKKIKEIINDNN